MDNETLEFVQKSTYRQRVLKALEGNVLMPKEIAERSNIKTNHVSKVLSELKSKELIEIINPDYHESKILPQRRNRIPINTKNRITFPIIFIKNNMTEKP